MKLHLFAGVLILSGIHDFYAEARAAELIDKDPESERTRTFRNVSPWIGRINFILGLAILYYAVRLTRG